MAAAHRCHRGGRSATDGPAVDGTPCNCRRSRRRSGVGTTAVDSIPVDATAVDAADTGDDPTERVVTMIRAVHAHADETLPLGRSLIRQTVETPTAPEADGAAPRRGYRRIGWIERALEPLRPQLDDASYQRLVSALAMVVGWEALIVLQDVRGFRPDEQLETTLWAARALVQAALDDSAST